MGLRVISALTTSLSAKQLDEIYQNLIGVLTQCFTEEFLICDSLICVGRLAHFHIESIKDVNTKLALFNQHYLIFIKKAAEICSNPKTINDYELLEGAYLALYFTVKTLKKQALQVFPASLIPLTIDYVNTTTFNDEIKAPESEGEEEEDAQEGNHYLIGLSYKSMIIAIFQFIGEAYEQFADEILKGASDKQAVIEITKNLIVSYEIDETDDVRSESIKCLSKVCLGLLKFFNVNIISDFLKSVSNFATFENINTVLNRVVMCIFEWVDSMKKCISESVLQIDVLYNQTVLNTLGQCINQLLKNQLENSMDPDLLGAVCQLNEMLLTKIIAPGYEATQASKYGSMKIFPDLSSKYVDYPENYLMLIFGYFDVIFENMFQSLFNPSEELDIQCLEELVGSLGEMINKTGPKFINYAITKMGQENFVNMIFKLCQMGDPGLDRNISFLMGCLYMHMNVNIFQNRLGESMNVISQLYQKNSDKAGIKDNCLSAMAKLYMNKQFSSETETILPKDNLMNLILTNVPLLGDVLEMNYIWRVLMEIKVNNQAQFEQQILSSPRLLGFVFKSVITPSAVLDDNIFDWLLTFIKTNVGNAQLINFKNSLDSSSVDKLSQVFI